MPIKVAIVEDDEFIRSGLAMLINNAPGLTCVATCATAEHALIKLCETQPDIVLMDIALPGMSGLDCIPLLREQLPKTQVMMLTVFEDYERIFSSLRAGATGYLLKKTAPHTLVQAVHDLHSGGSPVSSQIARRLLQAFQQYPPAQRASVTLHGLSAREEEILRYFAHGFVYKEIASTFGISVETVRTHVRNIYGKLHVRSRTELAQATRRLRSRKN